MLANPDMGLISKEVLQSSSLKLYWEKASSYHLTEVDRIIAQKDAKPVHFCAGCKVVHSSSICGQKQIKIVCSDSQFNGIFSQREPEYHDAKHTEYLLKSGACTEFFHSAIPLLYGHYQSPLEVTIFVGSNDLLRGHSISTIINNLKKLKTILDENERVMGKPTGSNALLIATVPLLPKLVGLEVNHYVEWLSEGGRTIYDLNDAIRRLNRSMKFPDGSFPELSGMGLRKKRLRSGVVRISHETSSWRETRMEYAIHLSNAARIAALKIVVSKIQSLSLQSSTTSSLPLTTPASEEVRRDEEEVEVRTEPVDEERSELFDRDFTDFEFS